MDGKKRKIGQVLMKFSQDQLESLNEECSKYMLKTKEIISLQEFIRRILAGQNNKL
jgi:hypothetical protein